MVVDDAAGLHERVEGRGTDEAEAAALEVLRQRDGLGRLRRHVGERARRLVTGRRAVALPDELVEGAAVAVQRDRRPRVGDRRLDLRAVADDARVVQQPLDVVVAEPRDRLGLEVRERGAKRLALAQDRQPGQAGLERLERHALEQAAFVGDRTAPLLVVIALVERVAVAEAARHGTAGRRSVAAFPTAGRSSARGPLRSLSAVAGYRSAARGELSPPLSGSVSRRRNDTWERRGPAGWAPADPRRRVTGARSRRRAGRGRRRRPPRRGSRCRET